MQPVAVRPVPCQGPSCHTCSPIPILGPSREIGFEQMDFSPAFGDLDGDGMPDMVVVNPGGDTVGVQLQQPDGSWSKLTNYHAPGKPRMAVIADVNGDGWPDVLAVAPGDDTTAGWVDVFQGTPHGVLVFKGQVKVGVAPQRLAVADLDGDGHLDFVVTNQGDDTLGVCFGSGQGTFACQHTYPAGTSPGALVLADLDGDGHLDAAVAPDSGPGPISVLRGRADGSFGAAHTVTTVQNSLELQVGDLDGDGHPDLLAMGHWDDHLLPLMGRGDGTFAPGTPLTFDGHQILGAALGDLDGDGHPDLVVSLSFMKANVHRLRVFHNDGHGQFSQAGAAFGPVDYGNDYVPMRLVDMNGDGHPDLVENDSAGVDLRLNDGHGGFPAPIPTLGTDGTVLRVADLNGDGRPDVVVGGTTLTVLLGQADGTLAPGPSIHAPFGDFAIGDVDGDGIPDLVGVGSIDPSHGSIQVLHGQGDGTFTAESSGQTQDGGAMSPVLADVDGDGHLDLLLALMREGGVGVRLGRGDGTFGPVALYGVPGHPEGLVLGDLDGDGIPDLVVALDNGIVVLLGKANGHFSVVDASHVPAKTVWRENLAIGDLDGDGHPDVVVVNVGDSLVSRSSLTTGATVSVLRGRGDGTFYQPQTITADVAGYPMDRGAYVIPQVAITDLDGDGIPDILIGGGGIGVLRGNRQGGFDPLVAFTDDGPAYGTPLAVADLDGNGRPDLVVGHNGDPVAGLGIQVSLDPAPACATP